MGNRRMSLLRLILWLPAFVAIVIAVHGPNATFASTTPGILATFYNNFGYDDSPPLPNISGRPSVGTTTYTQIQQSFDSEPMFGLYEDFIVKYEGHITAPITGIVKFWPWADDGTQFIIDGEIIDQGNWVDKGGGGYEATPQQFVAGVSQPFTYWFYENGGGAWTELYWDIGNGWEIVPASAFSQSPVIQTTTTTTIAPYINPITNLQAEPASDGGVSLTWSQPEPSNLDVYAYSITFFDLEDNSETGGWGIWTEQTSSEIGPWMWTGTTGFGNIRFKVKAGSVACFAPSQYQCVYGPEVSVDVFIPAPSTTTSTISTSTTTTSTSTSTTTTSSIPQTTTSSIPETTTSLLETPQSSVPEITSTVPLPQTTQVQEIKPPVSLQETTTTSSTSSTVALPTTSVPQNKSQEIPDDISPEESLEIASSADVLEQISEEEAEQVFEALDESSLTEEQAETIIEAVQGAPDSIRETFEDTVDLFSGTFDSYVMVGQTISVGERRTIVAVNLVTATVAAVSATGGLSGNSGGGPGGGGGGSGGGARDNNQSAKKDDEEESEMAGEIAGDGKDWVQKLRIYKTIDGERVLDWKSFIRKFWLGIMNLGFTIAGSVVVYFTLSGSIQKIALVSTLLAFASAMYLHMKEPE